MKYLTSNNRFIFLFSLIFVYNIPDASQIPSSKVSAHSIVSAGSSLQYSRYTYPAITPIVFKGFHPEWNLSYSKPYRFFTDGLSLRFRNPAYLNNDTKNDSIFESLFSLPSKKIRTWGLCIDYRLFSKPLELMEKRLFVTFGGSVGCELNLTEFFLDRGGVNFSDYLIVESTFLINPVIILSIIPGNRQTVELFASIPVAAFLYHSKPLYYEDKVSIKLTNNYFRPFFECRYIINVNRIFSIRTGYGLEYKHIRIPESIQSSCDRFFIDAQFRIERHGK